MVYLFTVLINDDPKCVPSHT